MPHIGDAAATGIFAGVRFVLLGFDSVSEAQYRAELVRGGAVDVGRYDLSCSVVIVTGHVYDGSICEIARKDGKILVTELWVDDCVNLGKLADYNRILYRPLKDLNGIPGSGSLCMCLTGYQRQEREDIMKMVSLMGSQFSKPLIANKVTHLICYKFEGEKYELAKRVNIKLTNHRWLEECLKAWEILPIDNFTKSGWELENLEAQALDSEEESEDKNQKLLARLCPASSGSPEAIFFGSSFSLKNDSNIKEESLRIEELSGERDKHKSHSSVFTAPSKERHSPEKSSVNKEVLVPCSNSARKKEYHIGMEEKLSPTTVTNDVGTGRVIYLRKTPIRRVVPSAPNRKISEGNAMNVDHESQKPIAGEFISALLPGGSELSFQDPGSSHFPLISPSESTKVTIPEAETPIRKIVPSAFNRKITEGNVMHVDHEGQTSSAGEPMSALLPGGLEFNFQDPGSSHFPLIRPSESTEVAISEAETSIRKIVRSAPSRKITEGNAMNVDHEGQKPIAGERISALLPGRPELRFQDPGSTHLPLIPPSESTKVTIPEAETPIQKIVPSAPSRKITEGNAMNVDHEGQISSAGEPMSASLLEGPELSFKDLGSSHLPLILPSKSTEIAIPEAETASCLPHPLEKPCSVLHLKSNLVSYKKRSLKRDHPVKEANFSSSPVPQKTEPNVLLSKFPSGEALDLSLAGNLPCSTEAVLGIMNVTNMGDEDLCQPVTSIEHCQRTKKHKKSGVNDTVKIVPKSSPIDVRESKSTLFQKNIHSKSSKNVKEQSGSDDVKEVFKEDVKKAASVTRVGSVLGSKKNISRKSNLRDDVKLENEKIEACNSPKLSQAKGVDEDQETLVALNTSKSDENTRAKSRKKSLGTKRKKSGMNKKAEFGIDPEKENKLGDAINGLAIEPSDNSEEKILRDHENEIEEDTQFVLNGPRPVRKVFQAIIRRLKGKLCPDTHQWYYQATHFIAPHPLRRTEKFFAAAASGRWILKSDYLTASDEAGKFLEEEPFEWHGKVLTEDGAISLEAPRKWRLMRERTGRRAFDGLRIIVYGPCIAPSLDTLKRAVKAGGGAILATCPPYSRFLARIYGDRWGIDYAVVGTAVPRGDVWVQEFLKHETPCVLPDYLVEYVCKPGFSLDRHVLYNTHSWAQRSLAKLCSKNT